MNNELHHIQQGTHNDPHRLLGTHVDDKGGCVIRMFEPLAEQAELPGIGAMKRIPQSDIFEIEVKDTEKLNKHVAVHWKSKQSHHQHTTIMSSSFESQISGLDLHLFAQGKHHHAYRILGAHVKTIDGIGGCQFSLWAPDIKRVSVVGDFNNWDGRYHPMRRIGESDVWELFIPEVKAGTNYKYELVNQHDVVLLKTDPYARSMALRPDTTSRVPANSSFAWNDEKWMAKRKTFNSDCEPMCIYEMHAGSWKRTVKGGFLNWRELARHVIPYVKDMGYTHIELMPVSEHALDESWGYQVTGYYAPTSRHGSADDFRHFIDQCHVENIGVLMDWVPAHFPKDAFALARFNGDAVYEHADTRKGEHPDWGTLIFNYSRNEVRNFLISNAVYWIKEFHIDGLRVDAVASMLYLNYSREDGEWLPNEYGGAENIEAIHFLRELNGTIHNLFPGVVTIAEESTSWPMVSRPVELGGLGFNMKWSMGWMNDSLDYIKQDPVYRKFHHNKLTFSQIYSYTENFVLPLSHDEVVHLKCSMASKMPGDNWQQFANLRLFYVWQYAHPGKKLMFMGGELAQWKEWNEAVELDWELLDYPMHQGIKRLITDLNGAYRQQAALHELDFSQQGFEWIDCNDSSQSILSFIRWSNAYKEHMICILNFTPVVRENYRVGVPQDGSYQEVINTDAAYYGGSDCGNGGVIDAENIPWNGHSHSINLTLPPLGALLLKRKQH